MKTISVFRRPHCCNKCSGARSQLLRYMHIDRWRFLLNMDPFARSDLAVRQLRMFLNKQRSVEVIMT